MTQFTTPSIVVGVDGSRAGVQAALWAVDEARGRELPLRLVSVGESPTDSPGTALREAADAVAAADPSVEVVTESLAGPAVPVLVDASHAAVMVCVGSMGRKHLEHSRSGSTAAALAASAHCPVAVVRGSSPARSGWIAVEVGDTADSATVLQFGIEEARLRRSPLRVVWAWTSRYPDAPDPQAVADGNRLAGVHLDRRLAEWTRRYPDLDIAPVVVHGTALEYLSRQPDKPQLAVVGAHQTASVSDLLGPAGLAALRDTSVLVVDPQRLL